jgi:hypothetical protein
MLRDSAPGIAVVEAKIKGMRVDPNGDAIGIRGNILSKRTGSSGYYMFSVVKDKVRLSAEVHKLQAYQKFGDLIFGHGIHIRHLDGNKLNNSWHNIEIGTQSDNMMDKPKKTRLESARKAASARKRYTDQQVRDMRRKKKEGHSLNKLAEEYNTTKGHMSYIINRRVYSDVV